MGVRVDMSLEFDRYRVNKDADTPGGGVVYAS